MQEVVRLFWCEKFHAENPSALLNRLRAGSWSALLGNFLFIKLVKMKRGKGFF